MPPADADSLSPEHHIALAEDVLRRSIRSFGDPAQAAALAAQSTAHATLAIAKLQLGAHQ